MTTSARSRWALLAALAALLLLPALASATTYRPGRTDDPPFGAGECSPAEAPPSCSLRGAVEAAKAGDTIALGPGDYELVGALVLEKHLTISGAGPGQTTIEQGLIGSRVIEVKSAVGLDLSGVTITGGDLIGADGKNGSSPGGDGAEGGSVSGAGISCSGVTTLTDVVVTGNEAFGGSGGNGASGTGGTEGGDGGRGGTAFGVGVSGSSSLILTRVAITGNVGEAGSGGAGGAGGPSGGKGGHGGPGGYSSGAGVETGSGSVLTMTDTLIAGNRGSSSPGGEGGAGGLSSGAGGIGGQGEPSLGSGFFSNGAVHLTNVTVSGNFTSGGIAGEGGSSRGGNSKGGDGGLASGSNGGGVTLFNGASGTFASVTLAGNEVGAGASGAGGNGSGSGADGANGELFPPRGGNLFVYSSTLGLRDSIITQGASAAIGSEDCAVQSATTTSLGHNLFDRKGQCVGAPAEGDKEGVAAGLAPLADNGGPTATMALQSGSAAIDAGEASCIDAFGAPLKTDQRGLPRGNPCDIGAFEVQPPPPAPPVAPAPPGTGTPKPGTGHGGPKQGGPSLAKLKLTPKRLAPGAKATIKFTLSAPTAVSFSLQKRSGEKWVKAKGGPKGFKRAAAGARKRIWKVPGLTPGKYRLGAKPAGGTLRRVAFTVIAAG